MGNLSNLYISESYQSLIHLGNDGIVQTSLVELQDGMGNSIGVAVNSAGDLSISGSLTASLQEGYALVGGIDNKTKAVPTSSFGGGGTDLTSLNQFTASQENINTLLNESTASQQVSIDALNSFTASYTPTDLGPLNSFTSSQESKNDTLGIYTSSVDTKFSTIGTQSGSWDNSSLNQFTSSQETKNATLASYTGSVNTQLTNLSTSQSIDNTKWDTLGTQSGSWVNESETGSFARVDVSNTFTQTQNITGDLNVSGILTANEIHTIIESSSVIFSSGSNIFGDELSDTQTLSGSVKVVGGLTVNGINVLTESVDLGPLNSFTASQETKNSTLATYTASVDTKFSTIGSQSGSWDNTSLNQFTSSQEILNDTFATTGSNTFNGSQNIVGAVTASTAQISGLNYPIADNGVNSFVQTDGNGNLSLQYVESVYQTIRNMSGVALDKGTPVFISGSTGDNGNAYIADASNLEKMPAVYIVGEDLAIGATGIALVGGKIEGVNTTGYPEGTIIYVAEGGGWSDQRPSGSNSVVQVLGVVQKEGVGGQGVVINQLEAVLPNLQEGYAWVGDYYNQPIAFPTSSFGATTDLGPLNAFTASQETYNTNNDTKWNTIGTQTGSYATTGSNSFVGNEVITGSLTITGSSASQKLVVKSQNENSVISETVITFNSSSILQAVYGQDGSYVTNNTKGLVNGTSEFAINNGLVNVPTNQLGLFYGTAGGFYDGTTLISADTTSDIITIGGNGSSTNISGSFTASLQPGYAWVGNNSGVSIQVPTSSFAENTDLGPLNSFTASQETKNNTLGLYTASVDTQLSTIGSVTSSLNSYTSSNDTKWSNLGSQSGSFVLESETGSFARTDVNNSFGGNQTFNNIVVNGTASIAQLNYVSGSATIVGDAFIVLNTDTPTLRYAGLQVMDSGSGGTASLQWDGDVDQWLVVDEENKSAYLLSGPTGSIGSEISLINNRITKAGIDTQILDSNISDDGINVSINSNTQITGSLTINGNTPLFDSNLTSLNLFTSSQDTKNSTLATYTGSINDKFNTIETQSGSWDNTSLNLFTASQDTKNSTLATYTGSIDDKFDTIETQSGSWNNTSLNAFTASQESLNTTFATKSSNIFNGNQQITGSLSVSGSINNSVHTLSIASNTASIDASVGTTFVLSLVDATDTRLEVSNTTYGQTLNLLVSQSAAGTGTLSFGEKFYEPSGSFYSASAVASAKDIVTLATFVEPNVVYVASIKNLIV